MALTFKVSTIINASKEQLYNAWLNSTEHNAMTEGSTAEASHEIGATHKAHGGYCWGKNLELIPHSKIIQSWRNADFAEQDEDSKIEVLFDEQKRKTKITLIHSNVPEKESAVKQGWVDFYFEPMKRYFANK